MPPWIGRRYPMPDATVVRKAPPPPRPSPRSTRGGGKPWSERSAESVRAPEHRAAPASATLIAREALPLPRKETSDQSDMQRPMANLRAWRGHEREICFFSRRGFVAGSEYLESGHRLRRACMNLRLHVRVRTSPFGSGARVGRERLERRQFFYVRNHPHPCPLPE